MVIVGGALAFTAIAVYFAWYFLKTGQARWRARAKQRLADKRVAAEHEKLASERENIAAK
jgi:hypothetical protein